MQDLQTDGVFKGIVNGGARVKSGSHLEIKGIINGDLHIELESRVLISGIVEGRVVDNGAEIEITGIVGSRA